MKIIFTKKIFTVSALLLLITMLPVTALSIEESWIRGVVGTYTGALVSDGTDCPVETTFIINYEDQLTGYYDALEIDSQLYGTLNGCKAERERKMVCTWRDKWGEGNLELYFNKELTLFNGFWSVPENSERYPWNGAK